MHVSGGVRVLLLPLLIGGCICSQQSNKEFVEIASDATAQARRGSYSQEHVMQHLSRIAAQEHPFGSDAQNEIALYLQTQAKKIGATTYVEPFAADTPNPVLVKNPNAPASLTVKRNGKNVYASANLRPDSDCVVLIGSHYDTKIIDGHPYLGANDSGSSSALLLEMLRRVRLPDVKLDITCDLMMVWFDGEESILANWNDGLHLHPAKIQDNTYGSRHAVSRLKSCEWLGAQHKCLPPDLGGKAVAGLVLVDMVGSPNLKLTRDNYSAPPMVRLLEAVLDAQNRRSILTEVQIEVGDDHVPYAQAGIQAIDLIDFVNTSHWHRPSDTLDNIAPQSLEIAYEIAASMAIAAAKNPKLFRK